MMCLGGMAMTTVDAIYVNGVFQPVDAVNLPEQCRVQLIVHPFVSSEVKTEKEIAEARQKVYAILGQSFETSEKDLAARHDEIGP